MREKWELWQEMLEEVRSLTKREYFLTLAVCILSGILLGILFSPKKRMVIGSFNGNTDDMGINNCECDCEDDCFAE